MTTQRLALVRERLQALSTNRICTWVTQAQRTAQATCASTLLPRSLTP